MQKKVATILAAALVAAVTEGFGHYEMAELVPAGGAWYVFNDTQFNTTLAPAECDSDFAPGTKVPDSCCESLDPYFGLVLADFFAAANCPATDALLPDFKVVRPYLSCDDDVITYGEECVVDGQDYPWPAGTDLTSLTFDAADATECGCRTTIVGPGCYKATDLNEGIFSSYASDPYNDGRQFFVKLEACVPSTT